jgi:hypothetical protein
MEACEFDPATHFVSPFQRHYLLAETEILQHQRVYCRVCLCTDLLCPPTKPTVIIPGDLAIGSGQQQIWRISCCGNWHILAQECGRELRGLTL